jgi:siroheme synthase (precorrin-2 oxidase/ferrochelatase)
MQELHNEKENRKTISEKLDSDMKAIVDERDQLRSTVERLEAENKDLQNRDKMDVCNENQPNYQEIAEMAERLRVLLKTFEEGSQQLVGALEEVVDLA